MKSFKWHRKQVSPQTYLITRKEKSEEKERDSTSNTIYLEQVNDKNEKAYEVASDIRKFEIELFWKRATYFWAFIAAIYTAYFNVLTKIYPACQTEHPPYQHGKIPLLVLSGLGLFFCFTWLLSSKASKEWQENWENHLDLLEDDVTGPLYKTYVAGKTYSVSRLVILAGWVVTVCAYMLLLFEFSSFVQNHISKKGIIPFFIVLTFSILVAILMYVLSLVLKGNQNNSGNIQFQEKVYEEM